MILQGFNSLFLIHLEGDHQIRLQQTRKVTGQHHGIAAVGTVGGTGGLICHDLAAALLAAVDPQAVGFAGGPLIAGGGVPGHVVFPFFSHLGSIGPEGFHFKFRAAAGTGGFAAHALGVQLRLAGRAGQLGGSGSSFFGSFCSFGSFRHPIRWSNL